MRTEISPCSVPVTGPTWPNGFTLASAARYRSLSSMRPASIRRSRIRELALMTLTSCHCPFRLSTLLIALAAAGALVVGVPVSPSHAQTAQPPQQAGQHATLTDGAKKPDSAEAARKSETAKLQASPTASDPAGPSAQKGIAGKAIDRVKEVAKSAGDIVSRVPCLP